MSRVSREQAVENRKSVVAAASALFRRKGLDGTGIDELMAEAGLTRGGFYGQFGSKDELAGEACTHAFDGAERAWQDVIDGNAPGALRRLADFYFTPKPPEWACPMATLAGDAARAPAGGPVRRAFAAGLRRLVDMVADKPRDDRALALMAAMVGAAVLRRASDDAELPDAIEAAVLSLAAAADAGAS
ncbi:MAG TPA: TetR/AcrR family transcriptional regulator [Aliidongia sp.]|nr:TetR/AcrR family transcriptional regulator [Aliidongia sp.]